MSFNVAVSMTSLLLPPGGGSDQKFKEVLMVFCSFMAAVYCYLYDDHSYFDHNDFDGKGLSYWIHQGRCHYRLHGQIHCPTYGIHIVTCKGYTQTHAHRCNRHKHTRRHRHTHTHTQTHTHTHILTHTQTHIQTSTQE